MLDKLRSADFAPYLNQTFDLYYGGAEPLGVELIEVTDLKSRGGDSDHRAPFSIVFRGPTDNLLPQKIYRIEHEKMGTLDIFLVPIMPDKLGLRYEAIFA
jgi:hypothetical protein